MRRLAHFYVYYVSIICFFFFLLFFFFPIFFPFEENSAKENYDRTSLLRMPAGKILIPFILFIQISQSSRRFEIVTPLISPAIILCHRVCSHTPLSPFCMP